MLKMHSAFFMILYEQEWKVKRGATFTIKEVVEEEIMGEYHYYIKLVMDVE